MKRWYVMKKYFDFYQKLLYIPPILYLIQRNCQKSFPTLIKNMLIVYFQEIIIGFEQFKIIQTV